MTTNYAKIIEITISKEGLTRFDPLNPCIKALGPNLRRLDVTFNHITKIENLEPLGNIRELNLSYNKIEEIEGLSQNVKSYHFDS